MQIKIEQEYIFKDVSTFRIPDFYHLIIEKTIAFFKVHMEVYPQQLHRWVTWQDNIDTGVYVKAGRATSTSHDWIIEGYIRDLSHFDPDNFVFKHQLIIQNSFRNIRIEVIVRLGNGVYEVYFEILLPEELEKPYLEALLGNS